MLLAQIAHSAETVHHHAGSTAHTPGLVWVLPFAALLMCIAILPLLRRTEHWWHKNKSKLLVAVVLGIITLCYYHYRGYGFGHGEHVSEPGIATVLTILDHAVLAEYIPFMSLLFSLYVISGGIGVKGDIPARPLTNVIFLAIGGLLASMIGTTGAAMLLIRPLLKTNSERKHVAHTVIFFIFIVANIGGSLLPIGDPPLFLGYLRGVPFLWTLNLWNSWAFTAALLLVIYWIWDSISYKHETPTDVKLDETRVVAISVSGKINFLFLAGVVFATGTLDPTKEFLGTGWTPFAFCRELVQLAFVALSLFLTSKRIRKDNNFNYVAILEVACLFIGIFVCMQVPIEILNTKGPSLGIDSPGKFFWATGILSSFLDNAPTYVVFFETAKSLPIPEGAEVLTLAAASAAEVPPQVQVPHLIAISLGAVFMGANTYIGNGPNFMVKSIAEHEGVKMPSFFGYMLFSGCVLIPVFLIVTLFVM
ncbi:MAG: sodium:proton antiporter [Planctomycetota bacterium]